MQSRLAIDADAFDNRLTPETNEGDELMALFLGTLPICVRRDRTVVTLPQLALGQSHNTEQEPSIGTAPPHSSPDSIFPKRSSVCGRSA